MNLKRYLPTEKNGLYQRGEYFPVLDMFACLEHHIAESAGFSLDRISRSGSAHLVKGYLDVHHPCVEHIKARIRCSLPDKYIELEQVQQALQQIFAALDIPADETYEAVFFAAERQLWFVELTDREGFSEWI